MFRLSLRPGEGHLDQGALLQQSLLGGSHHSRHGLRRLVQDRASLLDVGDRPCQRGQVGRRRLLEVEGEVRLGEEVGVPVALARCARDLIAAADPQVSDLEAPGLAGLATQRGDVDDAVVVERGASRGIHEGISVRSRVRIPVGLASSARMGA